MTRLVQAALWSFVVVPMLFLLNQVIPTVWYSPEIRARVVGQDGVPLADVVVVANWNVSAPGNGASLGPLALSEVATQSDGRFSIPAWGPRLTLQGSVSPGEPTLRFVKPGYLPRVVRNNEGVAMAPPARWLSFRLQGQDIALTPAKGDEEVQSLQEMIASTSVLCGPAAPSCHWRETPLLRATLECWIRRLQQTGRGAGLSTLPVDASTMPLACANVPQFSKDN